MKSEGIIHICLLILLQWISLAVVVLNTVALRLSNEHPQLQNNLVSSHAGLQDTLLIFQGIISFVAATIPLVLTVRCRRAMVLISELFICVANVICWSTATFIVLTHFHVSSSCRLDVLSGTSACRLFNMAITIGLSAIAGWSVLLIVASISMTRLSVTPTFVLENNPYLRKENVVDGYPLEKQLSAAPSYSTLPPPPASLSDTTRKSGIRSLSSNSTSLPEYMSDFKYPIYSIDSLPIIQVGGSKFDDLSFLH